MTRLWLGGKKLCIKTKPYNAVTVALNSFSPLVNKNSMHPVALPTSPLVATAAAKPAKIPVVKAKANNAKCSKQPVPNAAKLLTFRSVPLVTVRYIAKIATLLTITATKI
jgi:hypothetical protein